MKIKFFRILFSLVLLFLSLDLWTYQLGLFDYCRPGGLVSTYFNGDVYLISRNYNHGWMPGSKGDYIRCNNFKISPSSGQLELPVKNKTESSKLFDIVSPYYPEDKEDNTSGNSICTCVYNGKIYVFYDYINPESGKWLIDTKDTIQHTGKQEKSLEM